MAGDEGNLRSPQPIDNAAAKPPSAEELLARYAAGERDFAGTNLRGAVFDDADLSDVNLQGSDLTEASFRRAVLERADFRDARGLLPGALAGTNLRGARLPDSLKEFADIATAKGLADSAQKLFLALLGASAYTILTVVTTTDPQLMMVATPTELPIIKAPIPTLGFFWVAPLVLAGLFIYFHLYLQRLWETLARLPAIWPDGAPLDSRVDPWLLNGLVRRSAPRLRETEFARVPWLRVQAWVVSFAAWWLAPLVLVPIWWRYLTRHDWIGTGFQIGLIGLSIWVASTLRRQASATLRGNDRHRFSWLGLWRGVVATAFLLLLCVFSMDAIAGLNLSRFPYAISLGACSAGRCLQFPRRTADLFQAEAWPRPKDWGGTEKEIASARVVDFAGRDFRNAYLRNAFLVKVRLTDARLQQADLDDAQLQGADLFRAQLQDASLAGVQLQGANLTQAELQGADLVGAQLQKANLAAAQLQEASLNWAQLQGANLEGAQLQAADLRDADLSQAACLTREQLATARTDASTKLPASLPTPCRRESPAGPR